MRLNTVQFARRACFSAPVAFAASNSPVADAAMNGDAAAVQTLLQQKADVNAAQPDGATAISGRRIENDLEMADAADRRGRECKAGESRGRHAAVAGIASHGSAPMIDKLLRPARIRTSSGPRARRR